MQASITSFLCMDGVLRTRLNSGTGETHGALIGANTGFSEFKRGRTIC